MNSTNEKIIRLKDLIDHQHRQGLLNDHFYHKALSEVEESLQLSEETQRHFTENALRKRLNRKDTALLTDTPFGKMTELWTQESFLDEPLTPQKFKLLEQVCSHKLYTLDGIRPLLYKIRSEVTSPSGDWSFAEVLPRLLEVLNAIKEDET